MSPRKIVLTLLVGITVASSSVVRAAAGAPTVTFDYVQRTKWIAGKETVVPQTAPCPRGTKVVGGGSLISGSLGVSGLHATAPWDGDDADREPDDGWKTVASNLNPSRQMLSTFAACAKGASVRYTSALVELVTGGQPQGTQPCLPEEQVTGGGVAIKKPNKHAIIESTFPADSTNDADPYRDDGWTARVYNASTRPMQFRVWTICTTSGTMSHQGDPQVIADGATEFNNFSCPTTNYSITSGGFFSDADAHFVLSGNHPVFNDEENTWSATATNTSGETQNVVIYAICMTS